MRKVLILLFVVTIITACKKDDEKIKEIEQKELELLKLDIQKISGSVSCENASDWQFAALGNKPCGGPVEYIAYSNKIDRALFLKIVAEYNDKSKAFNEKWDAFSDCTIVGPPKGVACVNGKPIFIQ